MQTPGIPGGAIQRPHSAAGFRHAADALAGSAADLSDRSPVSRTCAVAANGQRGVVHPAVAQRDRRRDRRRREETF